MEPQEVETSAEQSYVPSNEPIEKKGLVIKSEFDWDLDNFDE